MKTLIAVLTFALASSASAATRNLVPRAANEGNLGTAAKPWAGVNTDSAAVVDQATIGTGASISTMTPTAANLAGTLNVVGATTLDGAVTLGNAAGDLISISGTAWDIQEAANTVISTAPGTGTNIMTFSPSNGYVGIGSATPGTKLDVTGTVTATDFSCTDCLEAGNVAADALAGNEIGAGLMDADVICSSIAAGAISASDLFGSGVVDAAAVAADALAANEISAGTMDADVICSSIAAGAISDASLFSSGVVDAAAVAADALAGNEIGAGLMDADVICSSMAAGTIVNADINASAEIAISKLATSGTLGASVLVSSLPASATMDITGALTGNADTATALAADPADCTNQYATGIGANGDLVCAEVNPGYVSAGALASDVFVSSYAAASIVNADINGSAAIVDSKLAQITTAAKVATSALTGNLLVTVGAFQSADCEALTPSAVGQFCYDTGTNIVSISTSTNAGGFAPLH